MGGVPMAGSLGGMIRHTVVFRLRHEPGSPAEAAFLADAERALADIPGVERFERLREVSPKNSFSFGLSMEFADAAAYDSYNGHPSHRSFVQDRWVPEVAEFQEIDYVDYEPPTR
jgi:Stress responsive A/B Barrel Domain